MVQSREARASAARPWSRSRSPASRRSARGRRGSRAGPSAARPRRQQRDDDHQRAGEARKITCLANEQGARLPMRSATAGRRRQHHHVAEADERQQRRQRPAVDGPPPAAEGGMSARVIRIRRPSRCAEAARPVRGSGRRALVAGELVPAGAGRRQQHHRRGRRAAAAAAAGSAASSVPAISYGTACAVERGRQTPARRGRSAGAGDAREQRRQALDAALLGLAAGDPDDAVVAASARAVVSALVALLSLTKATPPIAPTRSCRCGRPG